MPRAFSSNTLYVYFRLWYQPLASAADIARVTRMSAQAVSNVLKRGVEGGLLLSARLGRVRDAVDRYVMSNYGVEKLHAQWGWEIFWWHTAEGVRSLARRLEVVEMAYAYLPLLWQSNLVSDPTCYVYQETPATAWRTGEPVMRARLVEADWSDGRLAGFHWFRSGPCEAIATYDDGYNDPLLHLPVLWRGSFQKPADIASVRRDMGRLLSVDERWSKLPEAQAISREYCPGLVIFCSERVAAAMVQRNWLESATGYTATTPAIIDAQGQVVRAMSPPTAWWQAGFLQPPRGGALKDISRTVRALTAGAYTAVNGRRSWRTFRSVDGSPGVTLAQIAESVGVDTSIASVLLKPMVKEKVLVKKKDGHYLDVSGRSLLAFSQRVTPSRTLKRWGVYTRKGGEYRRAQRLHNQGQAEAILELRRHGYAAFPAMGVVIDYWHGGKNYRVVPDGFVVLHPGVLVALEFERSSATPEAVAKKARNYGHLSQIGLPLPSLFITETEEAARNLAVLRHGYLLATTLDAVREGPHGRTFIRDGVEFSDPGVWWYWYGDEEAPTSDSPIDAMSHLYVQSNPNTVWRMPVHNPFRLT